MVTYGTATYSNTGDRHGEWVINCEPSVASRLRRHFPRIEQRRAGEIKIAATDEACRDLAWFVQRFPIEIDRQDLLTAGARRHEEMETTVADLLAGRSPPPRTELAEPAREYQLEAAALLAARGSLLLADDVGVGKTITAICSIVDPANLPCIVVGPPHLIARQWPAQLKRFAPHLKAHLIKRGTPYNLLATKRSRGSKQADLWPDRLPDVIFISYHMLRGWADTLARFARAVVFDEVHKLRHQGTQIYTAAQLLATQCRTRLGMSATPIYNYGGEIHNVLNVLHPDQLGSYYEFLREWCNEGGEKARLRDPEEFSAYLRREGYMMRRSRADVGRELPPLQKVEEFVDVDQDVMEDAETNALELARVILAANETSRGAKRNASAELDAMMRQWTGVAKAPFVANFVDLLIESGEQVVLFGWHREVYSIWMDRLAHAKPVMYTGSESAAAKASAVERFFSGEARVLIMSLRSGEGVDGLQFGCRTIVFGELDWSPAVHEQCIGRVHRDGNSVGTVAYFLVAEAGSDPIVADVCGVKRAQHQGLLNPGLGGLERVDDAGDHIKRVARAVLASRSEHISEEVAA